MEEARELAAVSDKLRIFISWSGKYSNALAEAFSDWLNKVVQSVETFVSSSDIESGSRWGSRLTGELSELDFGVAFITQQNKNAPWVQFEAGALSKNIKDGRFAPILCGLSNVDLTGNPLIQFQTRELNADGMRKLTHTIFKSSDKDSYSKEKVDEIFDVWWPTLATIIEKLGSSGDYDTADTESAEPSIKQLESSISDLVEAVRDLSTNQDLMAFNIEMEVASLEDRIIDSSEFKHKKFKTFEQFKDTFKKRFRSSEIYALIENLKDEDDLRALLKIADAFGFSKMSSKINIRIEACMPNSFENDDD